MPERSFGRTVRYRRTRLGLSQAKLGELVGRSAGTIRAWERDKSLPTDAGVLEALAAILGINERVLFEKAGQKPPEIEASPTIEEALATLDPDLAENTEFSTDPDQEPTSVQTTDPEPSLPGADPPVPVPPIATYAKPSEPRVITQTVLRAPEPSYVEDTAQRQLYRLRNLATVVLLVALGVALVWALGQGLGALGDWWDEFFGNLRL